MAIDSADKRKSAVNWLRRILPIPDSVISAADRIHVAGLYRGLVKISHSAGLSVDLLLKKSGIDINISSDILIKKLDVVKSFSSDILTKKLNIVKSVTSDLKIYLRITKVITSDLLVKKLDILKSITSDLLLFKRTDKSFTIDLLLWKQYAIPTLCDILVKKLNTIKSTTIDILIAHEVTEEQIGLKSYINISEDIKSVITLDINDNSNILVSLFKFSETDSNISISRYSVLN